MRFILLQACLERSATQVRDAQGRSALELAVERGWSRAEVARAPGPVDRSTATRRSKDHPVARSSVDLSAARGREETRAE